MVGSVAQTPSLGAFFFLVPIRFTTSLTVVRALRSGGMKSAYCGFWHHIGLLTFFLSRNHGDFYCPMASFLTQFPFAAKMLGWRSITGHKNANARHLILQISGRHKTAEIRSIVDDFLARLILVVLLDLGCCDA